ncbi:MAG TPA: hypothetical protein VIA18_02795 [Polyangia bacterium]|nr:hypothetical protein [Polyangia bacterium]
MNTPIPPPPITKPAPKKPVVNPVFEQLAQKKQATKPEAAPVLEVSEADVLEDDSETRIDEDLNFEWAPVPSVPGMGR